MTLDGIGGYEQAFRDLPVAVSRDQQLQYRVLPVTNAQRFQRAPIDRWLRGCPLLRQSISDPDAQRCKANGEYQDVHLTRQTTDGIAELNPLQEEGACGQRDGVDENRLTHAA